MSFIDDDERGVWLLAPGKRRDRADLDGLCMIRTLMVGLHDADTVDTFPLEGVDRLADQRDRRNGERCPPANRAPIWRAPLFSSALG